MSESKRVSYSITLRANPNDKNKIELINYLKSFDRGEATKKVEDILMAALLSLAKQYSGEYTPEQLRLSGLENCNALSHHSSYIRQALNIAEAQHLYAHQQLRSQEQVTYINDPVQEGGIVNAGERSLPDRANASANNGTTAIFVPSATGPALEEDIEAKEELEAIPSTLAADGNISDVMAMFGT